MRRYVEATGPLNPRDLAHLLGEPLSIVSHHVRELESDLAILFVKDGDLPGCAADLYEATWWVRLSPEIVAALGLNPDEQVAAARKQLDDHIAERRQDKAFMERLRRRGEDELLARRGLVPLPKGLTTHKLRHAFASVLIALGEDPVSVMRQIGHTDPEFTLRVYTHMMSRDKAERERLRGLVRGERVIARSAPPPKSVDLAEYEVPIIAALAERGGRAPRREIIAAVAEAMADRHGAADLELLPSGVVRWQPRLNKARTRLVKRGWLEASAWRGNWELTERGWDKARRDRMPRERSRAAAEVEATETELAVAA